MSNPPQNYHNIRCLIRIPRQPTHLRKIKCSNAAIGEACAEYLLSILSAVKSLPLIAENYQLSVPVRNNIIQFIYWQYGLQYTFYY